MGHRPLAFLIATFMMASFTPLITLAEADEVKLSVSVMGVSESEGQVICSIFTSKETHLKEPLLDQIVEVTDGEALCVFSLPRGTYSVGAIYDQDSDGELDTGFLGIPKEAVGFSNNPKARFGPPGFEKTALTLTDSLEITIQLSRVGQ